MSYLLNISGWSPLDEKTLKKLENHKKIILIFPHTTCWDAAIYIFYYLKYDIIRRRAYTLINPRFGDAEILKRFGFIPSTHVDQKNGGMVKKIVDTVKDRDEYMILLSPKGTIQNREWRSGYYYLAKELDCEIVCGGLDYKKREFVFKEPFKIGEESLEEINEKCQNFLKDITPLNPDNTEFRLSIKPEKKLKPVSAWRITMFFLVLIFLPLLVTAVIVYIFEGENIAKQILRRKYDKINLT